MKKSLVILVALIGFGFSVNAQTTRAVPISNGCGSETVPGSKSAAAVGRAIDAGTSSNRSWSEQGKSCDQHDKDYYNQVGREKADNDFQQRSPVMGTAVKSYGSENSYNSAAQDRANSQRLQSTWEQERKQSLDSENYRVEEDQYGKWKKENGF